MTTHCSRAARARLLACLLLVASLAAPGLARGAEIEGVHFAESYTVGGASLELNCVGLLRHMIFIKGYVAALYLGTGVRPDDVLGNVPKRLVIDYFHAIKAADFAAATDKGVADNVDEATLAVLRPRLDELNRLYRDASPGDRYSLTYLPGQGTVLSFNGEPLGTIPGADFARAVFAIWLGPRPLDASLKRQLLQCS